ncbi:MAG: M20/M25/M40 family metallo-hydrolase [Chitinophagaceae bacterium]
MRKLCLAAAALCLGSTGFAQNVDQDAVKKIRKEGLENSKVMDIAFHLTDVSGPRLTNSPGFARAANWVVSELTGMGLTGAKLEPWGEFGKGWEQTKCYVAMTAPYYVPLVAIPRAWTPGTPGKKDITGEVILIKAKDSAELYQNYKGTLGGKIVMLYSTDTLKPSFTADGERYADTSLAKMQIEEKRDSSRRGGTPAQMAAFRSRFGLARQVTALYASEKPALVLSMGRGNDGTVFVQGGGSQLKDTTNEFAYVMLSSDDYLRIQRLVAAGEKVEIEANVKTKFYDKDLQSYNVVAEIPGTDPTLKDEVVMLGGHLDSWQGATGATDNAAGCAVMMEAVRILKATGLQPKRTIRIALWSGEEQGLFGSRGYVKNHFADPIDMVLKTEQSKVSAYFNIDNGTGKIRGIYTQGNKEVAPIFAKWLSPFADLGATTVSPNNTGSTDHVSFDAVGIPGFQFIQDPIEYDTRTHHSNMDTYDHLVPEDLKQMATIIASFVYNTAQMNSKLPRKELPKARGNNPGRGF